MKNYNKLSLMALLAIASNLTRTEGEQETTHPKELIPHKNDQKRFFLEEHIDRLQERRLAIQEEKGGWNKFTDTASKLFDRNHYNLRNDFSSTEVPHLTDKQSQFFKELSTQDQLKYINDWASTKWEAFEIERKRINTKHNKVMSKFDRQIKDLETEIKDLDNPSIWKKLFGKTLTEEEKNQKKTALTNNIAELKKQKNNAAKSFETFKKDFLNKHQNEFYEFAKKFDSLLNVNQGDDKNGTLQFNIDQGKFEIHKKKFTEIKSENVDSKDAFMHRSEQTNPTDFSGPSRERVSEETRRKEVDALQQKFENLVNQQRTSFLQPKGKGTQRLTQDEIKQRNEIVTAMKIELDEIVKKFKQNTITLEQADQESIKAIKRAQQKEKMAESQNKFIKRTNIEFKNKATTIINDLKTQLNSSFTSNKQKLEYIKNMPEEDRSDLAYIFETTNPEFQELKTKLMALKTKIKSLEEEEERNSSSSNANYASPFAYSGPALSSTASSQNPNFDDVLSKFMQ